MMQQHPDLSKYQKKMTKIPGTEATGGKFDMDNYNTIKSCLKDFEGGLMAPSIKDQMGMKIINSYNPLRERIMTFRTYPEKRGGYYVLRNVQKEKGQPDFYDIWLLTDSIKDEKAHRTFKDLHDLGQNNLNYWTKHMVYPYTHKFV